MAAIHLRIFGYIITLALHITNLTVMQMLKKDDLVDDVKIKIFRGMLYRYFTCWTVMLQILYALLGLYCDGLVLKNSKNKKYKLPKSVTGFRNLMFSALVWPCTMVVFTVFWTLFLYDRNLILPKFADQVLSKTSNHILHTIIVPIVIWELVFRPRVHPRSHMRYLAQLTIHMLVYVAVLHYTYITEGIWLYPIFKVTYGTINFVLVHICVGILCLMFYYLQWLLNYLIHGSQEVIKKKVK